MKNENIKNKHVPGLRVGKTGLEKSLENCDIIFITAALHESTFHLIDEKKIRSAKKGVKIINICKSNSMLIY